MWSAAATRENPFIRRRVSPDRPGKSAKNFSRTPYLGFEPWRELPAGNARRACAKLRAGSPRRSTSGRSRKAPCRSGPRPLRTDLGARNAQLADRIATRNVRVCPTCGRAALAPESFLVRVRPNSPPCCFAFRSPVTTLRGVVAGGRLTVNPDNGPGLCALLLVDRRQAVLGKHGLFCAPSVGERGALLRESCAELPANCMLLPPELAGHARQRRPRRAWRGKPCALPLPAVNAATRAFASPEPLFQ